jgi:hypothetical protein
MTLTADDTDHTDAVVEAFVSNACVDAWHRHRRMKIAYPLGTADTTAFLR